MAATARPANPLFAFIRVYPRSSAVEFFFA
jgi:hypothetical protein